MNNQNNKLEQPLLSHRFRVHIPGDIENRISNHIESCSIDYVNNEMHFVVRQPLVDSGFHESIRRWNGSNIEIQHMDSQGVVVDTLLFHGLRNAHKFTMNYADNKPAVHEITFTGYFREVQQ
jgi:hypothetical protein